MNTITAVPVIQVKKIDTALKRDAKAGRLICGKFMEGQPEDMTTNAACQSAGRCAIGALLFYAGFSPQVLAQRDGESFVAEGTPGARLLEKEYGILPDHAWAIIETNDDVDDPKNNGKRYEEVMGLISFVEVAQEQGIRFDSSYAIRKSYADGFQALGF